MERQRAYVQVHPAEIEPCNVLKRRSEVDRRRFSKRSGKTSDPKVGCTCMALHVKCRVHPGHDNGQGDTRRLLCVSAKVCSSSSFQPLRQTLTSQVRVCRWRSFRHGRLGRGWPLLIAAGMGLGDSVTKNKWARINLTPLETTRDSAAYCRTTMDASLRHSSTAETCWRLQEVYQREVKQLKVKLAKKC